MNDREHPRSTLGRSSRALSVTILTSFLVMLLTACGTGDDESGQIDWIIGTPPQQSAQNPEPTPTSGDGLDAEATEPVDPDPTATTEPAEPTPTTESAEAVTGRSLTADELAQYRPNELGGVPILEYHVFVDDPKEKAQFTNTPDDLRGDLEWLYENDFYVVPVRDIVLNQIRAPAGKHPVALTFDDSTAGQFRYLFDEDGTATIDPDSAVGIMEAFYQAHPDFGRGGFFALLPQDNFCFAWQLEELEEDQLGYCEQKLTFLHENGYELGNHTLDHRDLFDVDNEEFAAQLGGAIEAIQEYVPAATADIIAMPFGNYPKKGNEEQREMLRNGFTFDGREIQMLGALMVGSNPAESPVSVDWDPIYIARIQAWDDETRELFPDYLGDAMSLDDWFRTFEASPDLLYTSDGDPDTITIPDDLPTILDGTFDEGKAEGKEIVRY